MAGAFVLYAEITGLMSLICTQMELVTDVIRKPITQIESPAREGVYIHGLSLQGASYGPTGVEESRPLEITQDMGVVRA